MNDEVNNNVNNDLNVKSNNSSKLIITVLAILLIGALGFICYDKFINTEKPPVPTPTSPTNTEEDSNSSTTLKTIKLTTENQSIKIGNNSFNIRIDNEGHGSLYINDSEVSSEFSVDTVYVTDKFAFFTIVGQFDSTIEYAIDSNGSEIKVQDEDYYIQNIHLDDGLIVGKGANVSDALDENINAVEKTLIIKYENNTITVAPKN